jgi:hypothetical protein
MSRDNDPWELLREARAALVDSGYDASIPVFARIDAALAEWQDSTKDVVEWESGDNYNCEGKTWCSTRIGDRVIEIHAWDKAETRFYWRVFSTLDEEGHQPTLEEAKKAALAAARSLK